MARRYRMTPARRAAIKKAQEASARKRRRRNTKLAIAGGVVAVTGAAAAGHYGKKRVMKGRYNRAYQSFVGNALTPQLALPPGSNRPPRVREKYRPGGGVIVDRKGRQRGNKIGAAGKRVRGEAQHVNRQKRAFKVGNNGTAKIIGRVRGVYDFGRRLGYDPVERRDKYFKIDKPLRQSQAAARRRARGD